VTDHHAIIPTAISPEKTGLSAEESKIYDLICRRLLSAWQDDHIWSVTTVITAVRNGDSIDRFPSGSAVQQVGWKADKAALGHRHHRASERNVRDAGRNS